AADGGLIPSPGQMIRNARERARLTMEDLAAQMKLARPTLDALEHDNFEALLEPVYVRGYYRKCAKLLNLSEKDLIDAYQAMVSPKAPSAPSKLRLASGTELGSDRKLPLWMAGGMGVLALIVASLVWNLVKAPPQPAPLLQPTPAITESAAPPVAPAAATTDTTGPGEEPARPAEPRAQNSAPTAVTTTTVAPAALPPKPAATAAAAPAAAGSSAASAAGEEKPLTLEFSITSWARVSDGNGKTLLNSLMHAGDKRSFKAATPYAVFLGNAPGVTAQFEGKSVDLAKYTGDNLTARFSLPEK
ncbi:MAG TPA: RodZ domain-containing protein, partial [Nevskiaceae bacterium]|nr:RodZ domain-containing protein [Nevskiaceae bacterium]